MNVTVFGGAQPKPGDAAYEEARLLGELLAKAGHSVLTGGYIGTMEAVSRGASEAGAEVIGVTCVEIENYRNTRVNPWVKTEIRCQTLNDRIQKMIDSADAIIALPGGVGTLVEIAMFWNRLIINTTPGRPFILVGEGWKKTIHTFFETLGSYTSDKDKQRIRFAASVEEAVTLLNDKV